METIEIRALLYYKHKREIYNDMGLSGCWLDTLIWVLRARGVLNSYSMFNLDLIGSRVT